MAFCAHGEKEKEGTKKGISRRLGARKRGVALVDQDAHQRLFQKEVPDTAAPETLRRSTSDVNGQSKATASCRGRLQTALGDQKEGMTGRKKKFRSKTCVGEGDHLRKNFQS